MSQAGEVNVIKNHPEIATSFTTDDGIAIPIMNNIEILGGIGIETSASGKTIIINAVAGSGLTLTGNSGGPISPIAGNWNTVGAGSITVVGTVGTLTAQLTGLTNHAVLIGSGTSTITKVGPTATAGQIFQSGGSSSDPVFSTATYPSTTTISQILYSSATNVVAGLSTANRGVLTTGATGIPVITALAIDGQLIIGSTAGVPASATLTQGAGISITNASNSITIAVSGSSVGQTITGDSGGPLSPTAGNWNLLGSGSIATSGSGSTLTTALTGLTNHAVLVGAGTSTISKVGPNASSGLPLVSAGSSADPVFGTATVPGGGTGAVTLTGILTGNGTSAITGNAVTQHGVLIGGASNAASSLGVAATGTILAGVTGADPVFTGSPSITGNLTVERSNIGAAVTTTISNTDATDGGSSALLYLKVNGANGGDPLILYSVDTVTNWVAGVDNSDSDKWKLSSGSTLGVNDAISITTAGAITLNAITASSINFGGSVLSNYVTVTSFTPTITGSSTAGTATYSAQNGYYVRIGSIAIITVSIAWSSGTGTGNLQVSNLPFTSNSSSNLVSIGSTSVQNAPWPTLTTSIYSFILPGTANILFAGVLTNGAASQIVYDAAASINTTIIMYL